MRDVEPKPERVCFETPEAEFSAWVCLHRQAQWDFDRALASFENEAVICTLAKLPI